jgi:hypothetical protein
MAVFRPLRDLAWLLLDSGQNAERRQSGSSVMFGNWKQVSLAVVGSILLTATSVGAAIGPVSVAHTSSPSLAVTLVSGQAVI